MFHITAFVYFGMVPAGFVPDIWNNVWSYWICGCNVNFHTWFIVWYINVASIMNIGISEIVAYFHNESRHNDKSFELDEVIWFDMHLSLFVCFSSVSNKSNHGMLFDKDYEWFFSREVNLIMQNKSILIDHLTHWSLVRIYASSIIGSISLRPHWKWGMECLANWIATSSPTGRCLFHVAPWCSSSPVWWAGKCNIPLAIEQCSCSSSPHIVVLIEDVCFFVWGSLKQY